MTLTERVEKTRKSLSRKIKIFRRRASNAAEAFRFGESAYKLTIDQIGEWQVAYRHGTTDDDQLRYSLDKDIFLSEVHEYKPSEAHTILDVGSHIGTFALFASSKVPHGHVYAIEPNEENFNFLRINALLNKCDNVTATRVALSDREGTVTLYHREWNLGHSITQPTMYGEEVPTTTLQRFFELHNLENCDFAKFNCEGAEFPIILNTPAEVLRKISILLVLYHEDLAPAYRHEQLEEHLKEAGFKTRIARAKQARGWLVATRTPE